MKFFGKNISKRDFIPPVLIKIAKLFLKKKNCNFAEMDPKKIFSFSQYYEDLIIDAILNKKDTGFYVDVGANDPIELNNTKRFYEKGWTGINIEPDFEMFKKISIERKRDINLNVGVSIEEGELDFYRMSSNTLSSFNKEIAISQGKVHGAALIETVKIKTMPLAVIFDNHVNGQHIDFMSVDVEGLDLNVLKSNDWKKYRPSLLLIEIHLEDQNIIDYLKENKYTLVFYNKTNGIFIENNFLKSFSI